MQSFSWLTALLILVPVAALAAAWFATQRERRNTDAVAYRLALAETQWQHRLDTASASEQRLQQEIAACKQDLIALQARLDDTSQQRHAAERALDTAHADHRGLQAQIHDLREQLQENKQQIVVANEKHDAVLARLNRLNEDHARLQTEKEERDVSHARELANFEQQKASLSEQFKLLSSEILEAKSKSLQESSAQTLGVMMDPFRQSLESFKKEVTEIHHRETLQQGELRKELEQLKALNQKITTEAHELSTALRGQKKLQGNWGELVLENVLERSGLRLGVDYQREVSFTTEEGRLRPDVLVKLPQGKHLIIDAKVSLNAYTRYVNSDDDTERAVALREHVKAVESRIKELADREYHALPQLKSPEIVFMFIPIESAFVEALKADEHLFQTAIEHNVLVATPTTLLTSLNIVRQLWRFEDQNKHMALLADRAESVHSKLAGFLASFEKVKKSLNAATDAYNKAEGQLTGGRGNLVNQVKEFNKLVPRIKTALPAYFIEKASLELELLADDDTFDTAPADMGTTAVDDDAE